MWFVFNTYQVGQVWRSAEKVEYTLLLLILHVQMGTIHDVYSLKCMHYSTKYFIYSGIPVMTWDPMVLGDDRVAVPEVVASEEETIQHAVGANKSVYYEKYRQTNLLLTGSM